MQVWTITGVEQKIIECVICRWTYGISAVMIEIINTTQTYSNIMPVQTIKISPINNFCSTNKETIQTILVDHSTELCTLENQNVIIKTVLKWYF